MANFEAHKPLFLKSGTMDKNCLFWCLFCLLCNAPEQRQKDDISPVYIHQIGDSFEANQTLNRSLFFIFYCPAFFFLVCVPSFIKKEYLPI